MLRDMMGKIQKIDPQKSNFLRRVCLGLILPFVLALPASASGEQKEDESQYVRTGTLSYSKQHILAKDLTHITFKIKNHNPRTVTQIFGWVYRTPVPGKDAPAEPKMILVNNPHRGGLLVKEGPHKPGKVAQWRFQMDRNMLGATEKDLYTLLVSPKGISFARVEPAPEPVEDKKKGKK